MTDIPWSDGVWRNPPVSAVTTATGTLVAEAASGSDAWRETSYGFVHDTEHALLRPFEPGTAVDVSFVVGMSEQFDQAGVLVRLDDEHWIKAGVEFADGMPRLGAVVTDRRSDWSSAPVPDWAGRTAVVRASWNDGALTVRAGLVGGPLRFVRLAPFEVAAGVVAGPYLCAPTRSGFAAEFTAWRATAADVALH